MSAAVYYNDNDPKCCAWLRELIAGGHLPAGDVDCRPIEQVVKEDLRGYTQCHFFAGIGGWAYALRLAGWPNDEPVWTGSCPCQPFSVAGKRAGTADKRHLWPEFRRLIAGCKPSSVFGEQVASKDGKIWLSGVRVDLEELGYGVGAADLCAAGVGTPHIRQRLWWVANTASHRAGNHESKQERRSAAIAIPYREVCGVGHAICDGTERSGREKCVPDAAGTASGLGNPKRDPINPRRLANEPREGVGAEKAGASTESGRPSDLGRLGDSQCQRDANLGPNPIGETAGRVQRTDEEWERIRIDTRQPNDPLGFWSAFDLIPCLDGKSRRVESGTFPLAHGVPARVGRLRGYGNAIVPQVAAEFVMAYMETR